MHRLRRSSPIGGEQGSAIILALVVLTVIGTTSAAALSYLRTSLAATNIATHPTRVSSTSADAGMQTAIAYIRAHPEVGRSNGLTCPASTLTFPGSSGTVTVGVCPQAGSLVPTNSPLAKFLLAGANASEVDVTTSAPGDLVVYGDTFSNAAITANAASRLVVHEGRVWARRPCTGTIVVDPGTAAPVCSLAGAVPAVGATPAYDPAVAVKPANGAGSCAAGVATIGAGTYTAAQLQNAIGACKTVWLKPGVFYLNFANTVWNAAGLKIIGGTPVAGPLAAAPFPGGCVSASPGTQLIFGGASQIALSGGSTLDLCGRDTVEGTTTVKLAMIGLRAAVGGMATQNGCVTTINSCAMLSGSGNGTGVNITGTVFAPRAKFDFQPRGTRYAITDALVARAINVAPAAASPAVVIGTAGAPRSVGSEVLTASISGANWLSVRVALPSGANPTPSISDWVLLH
ncbi:MAG TPA: hypothetical protein VGP92_10730 [Acidimicrobiia bacterium]|nr:hypothetical protein [Acidimicrobiia bacterium]